MDHPGCADSYGKQVSEHWLLAILPPVQESWGGLEPQAGPEGLSDDEVKYPPPG